MFEFACSFVGLIVTTRPHSHAAYDLLYAVSPCWLALLNQAEMYQGACVHLLLHNTPTCLAATHLLTNHAHLNAAILSKAAFGNNITVACAVVCGCAGGCCVFAVWRAWLLIDAGCQTWMCMLRAVTSSAVAALRCDCLPASIPRLFHIPGVMT